MSNNVYDRYVEAEILNADPVKLVNLLYRGALEAIGTARRHLAAGQIGERSRQIGRAWEILQELSHSLDHSHGDLSRSLAELYHYMQTRLLDANAQQADAPLAEAERLLATLADAWTAMEAKAPRGVIPTPPEYVPIACSV